jgi:hypothetical protein
MKNQFGLKENLVQKRIETEIQHEKAIIEPLKLAVDRIKQQTASFTDKWEKIVLNDFRKEDSLKHAIDRENILYKLRSHPNIISKLASAGGGRVVTKKMRPSAFKWVDVEEKKKLGVHAIEYKNLTDDQLSVLDSLFSHRDNKAPLNDILCVTDYLVSAKANSKWVKLEAIKMASRLGQPIERTQDALLDLKKENILNLSEVKAVRGTITVCRLTFTKEEYELVKDQKDNGNIDYSYVTNKDLADHRQSVVVRHRIASKIARKKVLDQQNDNPSVDIQLVRHADNSRFIKTPQERIIKNRTDEIKGLDKINPDVKIKLDNLQKAFEEYQESVLDSIQNERSEVRRSFDAFVKMQKENLDLKEQNKALSKKCTSLKEDVGHYKKYHIGFRENLQTMLNVMLGQIVSAVEDYSRIPAHKQNEVTIANFKAEIFNTVGETSSRIIDYKSVR